MEEDRNKRREGSKKERRSRREGGGIVCEGSEGGKIEARRRGKEIMVKSLG